MPGWRSVSAAAIVLSLTGGGPIAAASPHRQPLTSEAAEPQPAVISVQEPWSTDYVGSLVVDGTDASETITVTGSGTTWTFRHARAVDGQGAWDVSQAPYCEHTDDPAVVTCEAVDPLTLEIFLFDSDVAPGDRVDLLFTPDPQPPLGVVGGAGPDTLDATSYPGGTSFHGKAGDDTLYGGPGGNGFEGDDGDDWAAGGGGRDRMLGINGDDVLWGDAPPGFPPVEAGGDALYGGYGNDTLHGQGGNDGMRGWGGDDVATGGPGDDGFTAGTGADRFDGGTGDDGVSPGPGRDVASLGRGADASYSEDTAADSIDCGPGPDKYRADRRDEITRCERFHHY
jgi:Ca2+-binding RTX toxin-like protein